MNNKDRRRIAFFLPNLTGGGAEKVSVNLLKGFVSQNPGLELDLVLATAEGVFIKDVPNEVRIVDLNCKRVASSLVPLCRYLRENQPMALLSHISHSNIVALIAKSLVSPKTRTVVVEHIARTESAITGFSNICFNGLMKLTYRKADCIVGVSRGVSANLEKLIGLAAGSVKTIHNPVITPEIPHLAAAEVDHPWLKNKIRPVFLGIGRLEEQKDFATLIGAFHKMHKQSSARLIIIGEGSLRSSLEKYIKELGLSESVDLPGFTNNPYCYLSNVDALVLSSRFEGLPTVLIEAMACGCPVVSTNCPSGPDEILKRGEFGELVPMGNCRALSEAMISVLDKPVASDILKEQAQFYSMDVISRKYLQVLLGC